MTNVLVDAPPQKRGRREKMEQRGLLLSVLINVARCAGVRRILFDKGKVDRVAASSCLGVFLSVLQIEWQFNRYSDYHHDSSPVCALLINSSMIHPFALLTNGSSSSRSLFLRFNDSWVCFAHQFLFFSSCSSWTSCTGTALRFAFDLQTPTNICVYICFVVLMLLVSS